MLDCPNLARSFEYKEGWRVHETVGFAIGYHYLGGHTNTPWAVLGGATENWVSPQNTTQDPSLVLVADLNVYCHNYQRILAPHSKSGHIAKEVLYYEVNEDAVNQTPRDIGATGRGISSERVVRVCYV